MKNKSFSLVELVIAVAILSIGITVILQSISYAARLSGLVQDTLTASLIMQDRLQEAGFKEKTARLNEGELKNASEIGKFKLHPELNLDAGLNLYLYKLRITWDRAGRKEQLDVATYIGY